jgi:methionyl aminopeptidase
MFRRRDRVEIKTPEQIELMRQAGLVVARTLERVSHAAVAGVSTGELDALAEETIRDQGAIPSFIGYLGYRHTLCTSVNDEVVHGIPGDRVLQDGDQISIDCGAIVSGWHGDAALTVSIGEVAPEHVELSRVTEDALWAGLAAVRVGASLNDIGRAIEQSVLASPAGSSYGLVEEYTGHFIGSRMHMDPFVPNFEVRGRTLTLEPGMALAIEPMVTLGSPRVRTLADDWTVVTMDGQRACHWEHTVAVTRGGPWVLTAADGGAARFAALGIPSPAAAGR